jgi:hypothetical protein
MPEAPSHDFRGFHGFVGFHDAARFGGFGAGADIWVALAGGNCSGTVNLFGRGQLDLRDWASYVGVLPAWSPNPAEWSPISKSSRCQADNETHGYDDRPDPLGRDAETAKQRYIVGSSPM